VSAYLFTVRKTFEEWDKLEDKYFGNVLREGAAVLRHVDMFVEQMAQQAIMRKFEGYEIPVVNVPYWHHSELLGELAESNPFAMAWFQQADGRFYHSMRSKGDMDVSEIAEKYGGGGHKNAAGFVVGNYCGEPGD